MLTDQSKEKSQIITFPPPNLGLIKLSSVKGANFLKQLQSYKPQDPSYGFTKLSQLPDVMIKVYKESNYFGQIMNRKKNGRGLIIYDDGRIYEGGLQNDRKHGSGYEQLNNGDNYEGQFVNGKPEGIGKYIWKNKETYEGQWLNGLKHGSGVWTGQKGDTYMGQWTCGKVNGSGKHVWLNGDTYQGEFKNCLKHGQGTEHFKNGDRYSGTYVNGKPEGQGEYQWNNGSSFKGAFQNGLRHGQGQWKKFHNQEIGDEYDGEYINDKKCGQGVFKWENGCQYKGSFFDDLRHGYGEMSQSDGSFYQGMWNGGFQEGEGEIMNQDGSQMVHGIFEMNKMVKDLGNLSNEPKKQQIRVRHYSQQKEAKEIERPKSHYMSKEMERPKFEFIPQEIGRPKSQYNIIRPFTSKSRHCSSGSNNFVETTVQVNIKTKTMNQMFKDYCDEIDVVSKSNKSSKRSFSQSTQRNGPSHFLNTKQKLFRIQKPTNSKSYIQYENECFF